MGITVRDLATHCGVSIGTVDRVLNGRGGVSAQTQALVERAIDELGYKPNYLARSLSRQKSMSVGVVLLNLRNTFFAQLSDAIVDASMATGYFPHLMLSQKDKERERKIVDELVSRRVDGIILFSTNNEDDFISHLKNCGIPVVTVMTLLRDIPSVGIDDYAAMRDAVRYVLSRQYQRLVYISPPLSYTDMNIEVQRRRHQGFLDAVSEAGVESIVIKDHDYLRASEDAVMQRDKKTAFICSSDIYSLNLVRHFKMKGLNAPYDYGVLGFDNIETLQYVEPAISTISVPIWDIGVRAVEELMRGIAGEPMHSANLPYEIVIGQTIV